jgi:hypothetical protein
MVPRIAEGHLQVFRDDGLQLIGHVLARGERILEAIVQGLPSERLGSGRACRRRARSAPVPRWLHATPHLARTILNASFHPRLTKVLTYCSSQSRAVVRSVGVARLGPPLEGAEFAQGEEIVN